MNTTTTTPASSRRRGHEKFLLRIRPDQIEALRSEALRRAAASGASQGDVSEVIREAVDAWIERRRGRAS